MIEISIIIPTYNRSERLRACLEALTQQTQSSSDFEVIVVVDGSTPDTLQLLTSLITPYSLVVISQNNLGQCRALNRGVEAAQGRYCLFLDDDMVASPRLVAEHLQVQRLNDKVVAIGQVTLRLPSNADWYVRSFAQGWREHYRQLNQARVPPTWEDCYSGNLSVPRVLVLETGGFDGRLARGFDVELAYRLHQAGARFVYAPDALSDQDERKDRRALMADAENAGAADYALYQRSGQIISQALASFSEGSWRKLLLRRVLLALQLSPHWLARVGRFIARPSRPHAWYSFVQNYCYWRGVYRAAGAGHAWQQLTQGVPILLYHAFGGPGERPSRYILPIARFSGQMRFLHLFRYHVISLEEFIGYCQSHRPPPPRTVIITFDDGYSDNRRLAYSILSRYRFPATMFLVSGQLGSANRWDRQGELAGRGLLSCSDAREMSAAGVHLGAHTRSHPCLTSQSPEQAWDEIDGSRRDLQDVLGIPIPSFAYPYGEYNADVQAMVERSGFRIACTVDAGLNTLVTSPYALRRAEVYGTDAWPRFLLALWFGDAAAIFPRRRTRPAASPSASESPANAPGASSWS